MQTRRDKLAALRAAGPAYPNDAPRTHLVRHLLERYGGLDATTLAGQQVMATLGGRLARREAAAAHSVGELADRSGSIEFHVSDEASGKANHLAFQDWDIGDVIAVGGMLFRGENGALCLRAHELRLLAKALREPAGEPPGPRYRELLHDDAVRSRFSLRDRLLTELRVFMAGTNYLEVETPILDTVPGRPGESLKTHHNALDLDLYLRDSPERHLKRLVVGGFERVYELNRSFRVAGGGAPRTPERTVLAMYCAYVDHVYAMLILERVVLTSVGNTLGDSRINLHGREVRLDGGFARVALARALREACGGEWSDAALRDRGRLAGELRRHGFEPAPDASWGVLQLQLLESVVMPRLIEPTFVTDLPAEACPAARRRSDDPDLVEHFRLVLGGACIGEGEAELIDPEALAALPGVAADPDYVRAVEYGVPPLAGVRLEVDRLIMLLAGAAAPADVVLFPLSAPDC